VNGPGVRGADKSNRLPRLLLGACAVAAFGATVVTVANVGDRARRSRASAPLPPTPAAVNQAATHPQPDLADYGTIRTEREGLRNVAKALLSKIGRCEHSVADPYGGGLSTLNACLSVPLHVNIMRGRFDQLLLTGVLRNMGDGACGQLTAALLTGTLDLVDASDAWTGDVGLPGRTQGRREHGDVSSLRQVASGVFRLSGLRIWRTVCRPRPYDAAEHGGAQSLRLPAHKRLPTHLVF
jgi:hypothetical protein